MKKGTIALRILAILVAFMLGVQVVLAWNTFKEQKSQRVDKQTTALIMEKANEYVSLSTGAEAASWVRENVPKPRQNEIMADLSGGQQFKGENLRLSENINDTTHALQDMNQFDQIDGVPADQFMEENHVERVVQVPIVGVLSGDSEESTVGVLIFIVADGRPQLVNTASTVYKASDMNWF